MWYPTPFGQQSAGVMDHHLSRHFDAGMTWTGHRQFTEKVFVCIMEAMPVRLHGEEARQGG